MNEKNTDFRYYLISRATLDLLPENGLRLTNIWEYAAFAHKIKREAWGVVLYSRPLTQHEIDTCFVVPDPEN